LRGFIRARPGAKAAADALIAVMHYDAILFPLLQGSCRTVLDAFRMITVVTTNGKMGATRIGEFPCLDIINPTITGSDL
jgi:hypothetical protein